MQLLPRREIEMATHNISDDLAPQAPVASDIPRDFLGAALFYARLGIRVLPIVPGTQRPLCEHGVHDATCDEAQIREWAERWPDANVALAMGCWHGHKRKLVAFDIDVRAAESGKPARNGYIALAKLEAELGELPPTPREQTPSGGEHRICAVPEEVEIANTQSEIGDGIDVLSEGKYIVAEPSWRPHGRYEWDALLRFVEMEPAMLSDKWIEATRKREDHKSRDQSSAGTTSSTNGNAAYVEAALDDELGKVRAAQRTTRNATLNKAAFALGQLVGAGALSEDRVRDELLAAAHACGLVADDGKRAALATIASGLRAGMAQPREVPPTVSGGAEAKPAPWPSLDTGIIGSARSPNGFVDADAGLALTCVADIEARAVEWLWPGRIARGKVTLIAGHPGLGKSQLALSVAATVTSGAAWPVDEGEAEQGSVIILSAEDDAADTIKPRLLATGADVSRCHILGAVAEKSENGSECRRMFSLDEDLGRLAQVLHSRSDMALVIIDPVTAYLGELDAHKNADVRGALALLADLAAQFNVAVVAITHFRKSTDGDAILKVSGSLAFVAAARAAYVVVKDKEHDGRRLFLPIKNNLGDDTTGYAFVIEPCTVADGIDTCRVAWEPDIVTISADEALAPSPKEEVLGEKLVEAIDFLRDRLKDGPALQIEIEADARATGLSWATVRRAAAQIGVKPRKRPGKDGGWEWRLPDVKPGEQVDV
jgi:hypothetical protein